MNNLDILANLTGIKSAFGLTDVGQKRDRNEDNYLLLPGKNIYIVADGMGGHNAGEVAGRIAIETAGNYFTDDMVKKLKTNQENIKEILTDAIQEAHGNVINAARENHEYQGMGCTFVLAFIHNGRLFTCHVGDSRVYIINNQAIRKVTNDHSTVGDLIRAGKMTEEEARYSPLSGQLSQALGGPSVCPEDNEYPINKGEYILLCTDGLWDMLPDDTIHQLICKGGSLKKICRDLINAANNAGGHDNITVILIKYR